MTKVYCYFGDHVTSANAEALKCKLEPILSSIKSTEVISIHEYGGPLFFPVTEIPPELICTDKIDNYFQVNLEQVSKDLVHFKKHREHLDVLKTEEFDTLILNFLLDLDVEVILENITLENYKAGARFYHENWIEYAMDVMLDKLSLSECSMKCLGELNKLRDVAVVQQIKNLAEKRPNAVFLLVRGSYHESIAYLLKKEGFEVESEKY